MRECTIIPAYASFAEAHSYVLEELQDTYNRVVSEIGLAELGDFIVSESVVLEADDNAVKKIGAAIKTIVDRAIAGIKALYAKLMKFIQDKQVAFRKKSMDAKLDKIKGKIETLQASNKKDNVVVATYKYDTLDDAIKGKDPVFAELEKLSKAVSTNKYAMDAGEKAGPVNADPDFSGVDREDLMKRLRGDAIEYKIADVTPELLDKWYAIATDDRRVKQELAASMKVALDGLNRIKKEAETREHIKLVNKVCRAYTTVSNTICTAYKERFQAAYVAMAKLAMTHAPKAEKEAEDAQPVNASATFQEEIDALFDWGALV